MENDALFEKSVQRFISSVKAVLNADTNARPEYTKILILTLMAFLEEKQETTAQGLTQSLKDCANYIVSKVKNHEILLGRSEIFLKSINDIFFEYMNKNYPKDTDLVLLKESLINLGKEFAESSTLTLDIINKLGGQIVKSGSRILVWGHSKLVESILLNYAKRYLRFSVLVSESRPYCEGYKFCNILASNKIPCKLFTDAGMALALEEADFVLTGAEAVVENGGIINRIGTYSLALCAQALKKPFYVVSESYKFTRIYPLTQKDVHQHISPDKTFTFFKDFKIDSRVELAYDKYDYTPPEKITLLLTDRGIFTPSAVSDELIQIFGK